MMMPFPLFCCGFRRRTENCDRLQEAAQTLVEGNVAGLFTVNEIECDEWTDIYITENKLKLYGDNDGVHTLKNVRFVVSADAVLRSDVPLELTGDGLEQVSSNRVTAHRVALLR